MKTINTILIFSLLIIQSISYNAQTTPVAATSPATNAAGNQNSFLISPRVGYDIIPMYDNNTPFIEYKGGIMAGVSFDYYWKWFGIGLDYDFIRNKTESTFPTTNLYGSGGLITNTTLIEEKINRNFTGIGPDFRYNFTPKFSAELNTRAGVGFIKGGRTLLYDNSTPQVLNFHAGYDAKFVFSTKLQLKLNYSITDNFGVNIGAYYINHYKAPELQEGGYSSVYNSYTVFQEEIMLDQRNPITREDPCNCNISSIGVFAGVTYKIPTKPRVKKEEKCDACETYSLAITARDKFTKEVLPNTDIAVKNLKGEVIETGTTNNYGVVVFNGIRPDNYTIDGVLHDVNLDPSFTTKDEFKKKETLQKEVIYSDDSFILEGNAVVCNTTEGIPGVKVKLINAAEGVQKSSVTNDKGVYILHAKKNKVYTLSGKKNNYFSQVETIDTKNFDRNTTLFIKLEICMEKVDCGKALKLQNIEYDLDKYFIRPDAKLELNRLVEFMIDNPSLSVELSSHTDSRGSDSYNMTLSQNRADAAVDYLVSQGIARTRLTGVGYGETKLLNECSNGVSCSKEKHQINRRTEMKVICPE